MFIQFVKGNPRAGTFDKHNIFLIRGDDESIKIVPEDFEFTPGSRIVFGVRESLYSDELVILKTIDYTEGDVYLVLSHADTEPLDFRTYVYDIKFYDENGNCSTIVPFSDFNVCSEVTYYAMQ